MVELTVDEKVYKSMTVAFKDFPKECDIATYHAINRTLDSCKSKLGRIIRTRYAVDKKAIEETMRVNRPSQRDPSASISFTGYTLSMAHFPHTPGTPRKNKYQVRTEIIKGGKIGMGRKAFIAPTGAMSADKVQFNVFARKGPYVTPSAKSSWSGRTYKTGPKRGMQILRQEIAPIRTLSVPQMVTNANVAEEILAHAGEVFEKRLAHELERAIMNIDKKVKK